MMAASQSKARGILMWKLRMKVGAAMPVVYMYVELHGPVDVAARDDFCLMKR